MRSLPALVLASAALTAGAAERPDEFGYCVPIRIDGADALYRLEIPQSAYEGAARGDLGDLRVFNGSGEVVPHAFVPRPAPDTAAAPAIELRFFPLYGPQGVTTAGLDIRAERTGDGTVVRVTTPGTHGKSRRMLLGYLVDSSGVKKALKTLELDWQSANAFSGNLRVEGSDDLARWTTLAAAAPLVDLQFAGQRLEQKAVALPSAQYKYLRLSWPTEQPPLELTRLRGRPGDVQLEPERRWKDVAGAAGEKTGEYLFDLGGRLPVDRLRMRLPEPNTLVSVQVLARDGEHQPWQTIGSQVVYRLQRAGQEIVNPALPVAGNGWRYWLVRVDQKGGGLGQGVPWLHAGWVPQQLVFVARGSPPFELAYGNARAQPATYSIDTVVPGWRSDEELKASPAQAGPERELAGSAALRPRIDYKTWALWASLLLGVALLAWMAWQLARQMKNQK